MDDKMLFADDIIQMDPLVRYMAVTRTNFLSVKTVFPTETFWY